MGRGEGFGVVQRTVKQKRYILQSEATDEFLASLDVSSNVAVIGWTPYPGKAKVYNRVDAATAAAKQLMQEHQHRIWICSRQDMGTRWGVIQEFVLSSTPDDSDVTWEELH